MYIQDYCFLQFISCVHQLNSLTEIIKHARGMKEKTNATRYIEFFLLFFLQLTMNDFSVHRIIGRGGFGEVYGCRKADTGKM